MNGCSPDCKDSKVLALKEIIKFPVQKVLQWKSMQKLQIISEESAQKRVIQCYIQIVRFVL